jgi:TRAP-type C4-dicarboxylate transport system substrate-binding protein
MKKPIIASVALAGILLSGTAVKAQEHELTMAVLSAPGTAYSAAMNSVPELVEKATDGRVKITLNDSIVGGPQITPAVRDGRVPMSGALQTYLASEHPLMGLFNLPGLIDNMMQYKFVYDAFWGEDLAKIWREKYNAVVLADGAWCTQQLFSKEPIRTLEDFKNKKLRVHNPQTAALMEALGAKPAPLPLSEVMPALERGVIDGLFTSTCYGGGQEYWRVADNVQNWKLGPITGWAIIANQDTWNDLPSDLQADIREAMQTVQHQAIYNFYEHVRASMKKMRDEGVEFWVAPKSERDRIFAEEYVKPVYERWYEAADEVGIDGRAYIERVRHTLGKTVQ